MTKKPTPLLTELLNKIEAVCKNKSELARRLGVERQYLHKWVTSREVEPGGEVTLQMLAWVQAEEAKQQKSRGSVLAPPRPKTRKPHHTNEKSNRVQKKR